MSENEATDDTFRARGSGGHSHGGSVVCGRGCPGYRPMIAEKTAARFGTTLAQNSRGEWVPAIPEPYFLAWGRVRCDCGERFRNRLRYREHFALAHVLGMDA